MELLAREHDARVARERRENLKLEHRQLDGRTANGDITPGSISREIAGPAQGGGAAWSRANASSDAAGSASGTSRRITNSISGMQRSRQTPLRRNAG